MDGKHSIAPGRGTLVGRTASEGRIIHIPDVLADPEYVWTEVDKLQRPSNDAGRTHCCAKKRQLASSASSARRYNRLPKDKSSW